MKIHNITQYIKWTTIKKSLFYESDYGLRFDTRTPDIDIGTLEYFDNAVEKAITIFLDLFEDVKEFTVVINSTGEKLDFKLEKWSLSKELVECFNLTDGELFNEIIPFIYGDDDSLITIRTVVKVKKSDFDYYKLIKRICRQDIGRSPSISDEVFILNDELDIAYNFYDDRGVDVASVSGDLLNNIFNQRKDWLYDYKDEYVIKM